MTTKTDVQKLKSNLAIIYNLEPSICDYETLQEYQSEFIKWQSLIDNINEVLDLQKLLDKEV